MSRGCPGTLLGGTPYNISAMPVAIVSVQPGAVRVQCLRTAPQMRGSAGTMSPHCPPDEWQCRDNVSTLPWAVQKHCTHITRGSMETLYGVTPNNVPGQPQYIVRGYPRQCRGSLFCFPRLNWESYIPITFKCIPVSNRMTEQMRIIQTGTDQLYSLCSATYIHTTGSSKTLPSTGKCHIDLSVTVQCSVEGTVKGVG